MRAFALAVLLSAVLSAQSNPPSQAQTKSGENQQSDTKNGVANTSDQQPSPVAGNSKDGGGSEAKKETDTKPHDTTQDSPNDSIVAVATVVIALATIGQAVIYGLQTGEMKKALAETVKAANAARSSADSLIIAERAWLKISPVIHSEDNIPNGFWFQTTNAGKTPARITALNLACVAYPSENDVPKIPDYSKTGSHVYRDGYKFLLLPKEKLGCIRLQFPPDVQLADIWSQKVTICAYGFVTYIDAFDIERTFRFGFIYLPPVPPGKRTSQWYHIPSKEYNEQQ